MGRRKKRAIGGKHLIIISSIIALNAMGLSYAYWTGQLEIKTTFTTGSINPIFNEKFDYQNHTKIVPVKSANDNNSTENNFGLESNTEFSANSNSQNKEEPKHGELYVTLLDDHTMSIDGWLEGGYKALINYSVSNKGTIPVKYDQSQGQKNEHEDLQIQDVLKVQVTQESEVIEPQGELFLEPGNGNPKVQIQVANGQDEKNKKGVQDGKDIKVEDIAGVHTFELKLPFDQWTKK